MLINFDQIPENVIPNFKGGEGQLSVRTFADENNKIMLCLLTPGSTTGLHVHDTSSEIIYVLSGAGKELCDGQYEPVSAGSCHYCPQGSSHSLINDGGEDLIFFAVVPKCGA